MLAGKIKWKSDKTRIAKVKKSGKKAIIKGVSAGKATVTASYKGKKYKCKVTVKGRTDKEEKTKDNLVMHLSGRRDNFCMDNILWLW